MIPIASGGARSAPPRARLAASGLVAISATVDASGNLVVGGNVGGTLPGQTSTGGAFVRASCPERPAAEVCRRVVRCCVR
ncbi:hypothetical protein AKJ09_09275 [Labilithrix luteola]|uniref:Uncharacterized protein n=1 Tax=Labilithrix luteola TaxID=1391654 RepID=A0A0K1QAA8_9BACT|nr:hypothetical protein AKJ09_09275 [Labilithrix luteola]